MLETKKIALYTVGVIILIAIVIFALIQSDAVEGPKRVAHTELAQCIADSDATFFGAFWCPACAQQKNYFGTAAKKLPYFECSESDRSQNQACTDEGVRSYPTWKFENGTVCGGVVSPEILAALTSCALPEYGDKSYTSEGLYKELVEDRIEQIYRHNGTPESEIKQKLIESKAIVSLDLQSRYGNSSIADATPTQLLTSVAYKFNGCRTAEEIEAELERARADITVEEVDYEE